MLRWLLDRLLGRPRDVNDYRFSWEINPARFVTSGEIIQGTIAADRIRLVDGRIGTVPSDPRKDWKYELTPGGILYLCLPVPGVQGGFDGRYRVFLWAGPPVRVRVRVKGTAKEAE